MIDILKIGDDDRDGDRDGDDRDDDRDSLSFLCSRI